MRVLIADDSVLLREGLALILTDGGHEVVGGVGDGEALVSEALRLRPDVVVADIRMPPSHTDEGLRATTRIRDQWPGAPILLLSQYVVAGYLPDLLADGGGALGYLLKDRVGDIDAFLSAVERVARGELVLDPDVVSQVLQRGRRDDPLAELTPREREVCRLVADGLSNAEVAERICIEPASVKRSVTRILAKLGLRDRVQLAVTWYKSGMDS